MENPFIPEKESVCVFWIPGFMSILDFTGRIWTFYDFLDFKRRPYDDNGHGTHVPAGGRRWHCFHGKYRGAAPGCGIISLKVLDRLWNGQSG